MTIAVTVVVPVHNTGRTVLTCVDSLREQTMPRNRFEAVFVDDGSTDGTGALLDRELADEPNFQVVHTENSGWAGRPRNIGMDRARGEYVYFVDDDDWIGPEALERLHARAVEDDADIVLGRQAGHGRNVPREVFQKPLSRGDIRRDHLLLTTMTVQKLFRLRMLREHGIRFEEGRVRLEDHLFMLRAYLVAGAVSSVHDYTCYHAVRHRGVGNTSFARIEPGPYYRSLRAICDVIDEHIEPGPLRNRFLRTWYTSKVLAHVSSRRLLAEPDDFVRHLVGEARSLAADRIPVAVDASLQPHLRVLATTLRQGDADGAALRALSAWREGAGHRTRVTELSWDDGRLVIGYTAEALGRGGRQGTPARLVTGADGRVRLDLPPAIAALPGMAEAADVTDRLPGVRLRTFLRSRDHGSDTFVPTRFTTERVPLGSDGRSDQGTGSDADGAAGAFTLRFTASAVVDAEEAARRTSEPQSWDVHSRLEFVGQLSDHRLGAGNPDASVEERRTPAFLGSGQAFGSTSWSPRGHLTVSVNGTFEPLARAVRDPRAATATREGPDLAVAVPMAVHVEPDARVPLHVLLTAERGGREVRTAGLLTAGAGPAPDGRPGRAVLSFRIPEAALTGAGARRAGGWRLSVGRRGRTDPLRLALRRRAGTVWRVVPAGAAPAVRGMPRLRRLARRGRALLGRLVRAVRRR